MNKLIPIDSEEKEMCVLCIIGIVYEPYMSPIARKLYASLTEEEKEEIKILFKRV